MYKVVHAADKKTELRSILKTPTCYWMLIAVSQVELYWQILVSGSTMVRSESESSSVGRAAAFQAEGRRFETGLSLQDSSLTFLISSSGVEQSGSSSGS